MNTEQNKKTPPSLKNNGNNKNNKGFSFYWIYAIIAVVFILIPMFSNTGSSTESIQWGKLKTILEKGHAKKIVVINKDESAEVFIRSEYLSDYPELKEKQGFTIGTQEPFFVYNGDLENFGERIQKVQDEVKVTDDKRVYVSRENRVNYWGQILGWVLPIGLIILFYIFLMRRMAGGAGPGGGQIFNIGKSRAQLFDGNKVSITFKDVAGLEEAKVEIMEIVDFLKNPKKYTNLGGKIPKGALLVGPPGTGKTLLAKAVAGEAKVPFFSLSGSDFVEMFVGVGASRVRDLFKQAKEKAPCIIFIDEIDAIGRARGKNQFTGANDERENTLNQLLTEMDGFQGNQGVIILAATNRADVLDRALMRAGRFDRQIHVELPDMNERQEIFKVHTKPLKMANDIDISLLAKQTPGFSGADIANVCNEAALIAARRDSQNITKQDFLDAIDRIVGGLEKRNKIITKLEKSVIAHHEAGHASVSWLLEYASPLVKVTIIPRGRALGAAWYLPEERQITTLDQMFDEMTSLLGGRAAEQIIFGKSSTGALNDLERVTKQAYAIIAYFGLNDKIGNISYYDSSGQAEYSFTKPYSEKTAELIDKEVHDLVEKAYQRALKILNDNREKLESLAQKLLSDEVIFYEDVEEIFGPRNFDNGRDKELKDMKIRELSSQKKRLHKKDENSDTTDYDSSTDIGTSSDDEPEKQ
ncbi:MAG: ATP-dependent zinc metalloprotease FtsH [Bacteroidales bacterium]|nr:ATP-dependent zinc metalloprotease FtsH [Bacteroidales bacterium]